MRSFLVPDGGSAGAQQACAQVIAIHAALLPSGKILYFGGDQHDPGRHHLNMVDAVRLFDCGTLSVSTPSTTGLSDFFCCGHAFLPSGQPLIGGGTQYWMNEVATPGDPHWHARDGHFRGLRDTWRFDPSSETFHRVADMQPQTGQFAGGGRWYPTLRTLGDGRVAAIAGHPSEDDTEHFNFMIEAFHDDGGAGWWEALATLPYDCSLYPRVHLLPDGRIFFSSPLHDGASPFSCYAWTHLSGWTPICPGPGPAYDGIDTTAVLLPLVPEDGYRPRVLLAGSSAPLRIDLGTSTPTWHATGARTLIDAGSVSPARHNVNAVLLPTGDVAVVGGVRNVGDDPGSAVHEIEIYRHETDSWVTLPAAANLSISRSYHSVALLMPDGRVWVAGSNVFCTWSFHDTSDYPHWQDYPNPQQPTTAQDGTIDHRHLEIEIFEPWYVGRPDRPTFTLGSGSIATGATLVISCPQAVEIDRVVLLRAGTATHSFNPDQRWVAVPFSLTGPRQLTATLPANSNLLPPGPYLVFVLRQVVDPTTSAVLDVPSTGAFVTVHTSFIKRLKPEIDVFRKPLLDGVTNPKLWVELPKMLAEGVVLPPEEIDPLLRQGQAQTAVGQIAERIDHLEELLERSKVFVRSELRPPVGREPVRRSFAFTNQVPPIDPMLAHGADMEEMRGAPEHHDAGKQKKPGPKNEGPGSKKDKGGHGPHHE